MPRRGTAAAATLWAAAAFLTLVSALSACGPAVEKGTTPPSASRAASGDAGAARDVLLITIDTLRADVLGYAGGPSGISPHLDRLAATGRTFPRAYAHAVLTLPSHASILTGLYPHQHGVRDNSGFRLAGAETLASRLAAEGFATAAFVAAFPLDARFGLDHGFDLYDDRYPDRGEADVFSLAERPGGEVVAPAVEWWQAHAGQRRFLWVHLFEPHNPYAPAAEHRGRFPHPYLGEVATADALLAPLLEPLMASSSEPSLEPQPAGRRREGRGAAQPLVVVTSDHGESLGEHGEMTHGLFAYDATLRVPLILWGPVVPVGEDPGLARHVDLVPTVLAAVGAPPDPTLPGRSLLTPSAASDPTPRTSYFEALHAALNLGWAPLRGVVDGGSRLKYIELPLPELYDLGADPREAHNRIAERRRDAGRLDAELPTEPSWPPVKGAVTAADAEALAGLGYLAGTAEAKRTYTAEDDPKRLVDLDRRMHRMHRLFADGQLAEAEAEAREVIARRGDMEATWSFLAQVLLHQGRSGEALVLMEEAGERGVASDALRRQHGLALAWLGRADEAVAFLEPLAADGDPAALNSLGTALVEAGRAEVATAVLARVLQHDPDDARAHETLSMAHLALGRWAEAEAAAWRSLAADPRRAHAWNNLGVALYRRGDRAAALDAWQRSVALEPRAFDTLYNLGVKAAELGRPDLARDALERFVQEAPPARYAADIDYSRALLARLGGEAVGGG